MATLADFQAKFPTLGSEDETLITDCLAEASREVSATAWGTRSDDGILWLAAHILQKLLDSATSDVGAITQMKVGDRSVSFASSSSSGDGSDWYSTTKYGTRYIALRKLVFGSRKL